MSVNSLLKRHLLKQLMDFEIILQECSLSDPLPKLLKWIRSAKQKKMATRAKNRKTFKRHLPGQWPNFKIISQKCSSHAPLPKLLKWFSVKQDGARAKNRKKPFKRHLLLGQWPNFKIISLKCSSHAPLPK